MLANRSAGREGKWGCAPHPGVAPGLSGSNPRGLGQVEMIIGLGWGAQVGLGPREGGGLGWGGGAGAQKSPQSLRFSLMMMSVTASKTNLTFSVSVAQVMWE